MLGLDGDRFVPSLPVETSRFLHEVCWVCAVSTTSIIHVADDGLGGLVGLGGWFNMLKNVWRMDAGERYIFGVGR